MRHRRPGDEGSALILALIAAFLLLIVSFEVAHTSRIEGFITYNIEDETRLEVGCRAGLEKALAVLREDRQQTEIDSLNDPWATLIIDDQLIEADIGESEFLFEDEPDFGLGFGDEEMRTELHVRIFDECAKWNVYLLLVDDVEELRKRKDRFATLVDRFRQDTDLDMSFPDGRALADQIHSFLRRTADRPYKTVPKPPTKRPDSLTSLDELLYVEGIDPSILYDTTDENGETVIPGLFRFVTCWSDMQINLNTGELPALAGLFDSGDSWIAERIFEYRDEAADERAREESTGGGFGDDDETDPTGGAPFTQINELREKVEGMTQKAYNDVEPFVTVSSQVFSIFVTAKRGFVRRTKMFVVRRSEAGFQVLHEKPVDFPYFEDPKSIEEARQSSEDGF